MRQSSVTIRVKISGIFLWISFCQNHGLSLGDSLGLRIYNILVIKNITKSFKIIIFWKSTLNLIRLCSHLHLSKGVKKSYYSKITLNVKS